MNTPKDETENDFLFQLQVYKEEGAKGLLQVLDIDPFYLGENEISNLNKFIDNHALHNRQQAEEQGRKKEREDLIELRKLAGLCIDAATNQLEKQRTQTLFRTINEYIDSITQEES